MLKKILKFLFKTLLNERGATNFPGSLDSYATKSAGDTIAEGHINDPQDAIEAVEAKVGIGATTPAASKVLMGTGAGVSAWTTANAASSPVILDASGYVPDISVDTSALKTATSEVSATTGNAALLFTGTSYGFYPQFKGSAAGTVVRANLCSISGLDQVPNTTYVTTICMYSDATGYAQMRYVTASGTDTWIFLLVDKLTGEIRCASAAEDHPSYGNSGNPDKVPHPFGNYDKAKYEVVLVDNDTVAELKAQVTEEKSLLTLVNELYKPDMSKEETYEPLHSGRFMKAGGVVTKVMIKAIPDYIKVRKLIKK